MGSQIDPWDFCPDEGEGMTPFPNLYFDLDLDHHEVIVLLGLSAARTRWPDENTGGFFGNFNLQQLASLCFGMSIKSIIRALRGLADRGFIDDFSGEPSLEDLNFVAIYCDIHGRFAPANNLYHPCAHSDHPFDSGHAYRERLQRLRRIDQLSSMPYPEYLESPEWKSRRLREIERAGSRCELCNSPGPFHVHHRTYERRGNEAPGDLIVLCPPCHQSFHEHRTLAGEGQ